MTSTQTKDPSEHPRDACVTGTTTMAATDSMLPQAGRTGQHATIIELCNDFKFTFLAGPEPQTPDFKFIFQGSPAVDQQEGTVAPAPPETDPREPKLSDSCSKSAIQAIAVARFKDMRQPATEHLAQRLKNIHQIHHMIRATWAIQEKKSRLSLLGLPRELRDIVYDYATAHFEVRVGRKKLSPRGKFQRNTKTLNNTGLLFVSKQLGSETILPYLKNTIFTFRSEEAAFAWLRTVPEYPRKFLKHVRLELTSEVELAEFDFKRESRDEAWLQRKVKKLNSRASKCIAAVGDGVFRELGMPAGFHFEVQSYRIRPGTFKEKSKIEYSW